MLYQIVRDRYVIDPPAMNLHQHPAVVAGEDLYPDGPDQAEQLQRLIDLGAIVAIPEAE